MPRHGGKDEALQHPNTKRPRHSENPGSCTPASGSKLLKEVLKMDKDVLIDRSHGGLQARKPDGIPRVIVAKVHYNHDCVEVLRRARDSGPLQFTTETVIGLVCGTHSFKVLYNTV